jgi:hypothetical protein
MGAATAAGGDGMNREQAAEIFDHLFEAALALDEARAAAAALAAQDETADSLEEIAFRLGDELIGTLFEKFEKFPGLMIYSEFPAICSTLTWDQVQLPPSVTEADIDAVVFSVMKPVFQKVAMVIIRSLKRCKELGLSISNEAIAARLRMLADADRIEGAGDLRAWRHSEVRLKS